MLRLTEHKFLHWLALATTILIWAGYLVAVRAAASTELTPVDVGILRSVPAALIFLPLTLKRGLFAGGANWSDILCIGIVGGTLFTLFLNNGTHFAPVADSGIFAPSMLPVFVTVLSVAVLGASFHLVQYLGVATIVFGAVFVGGWEAIANASSGSWKGHLLFLCASFSWAIYTLRFRVSSLSATDGAIILVTWSALIFLGLAGFLGSNLSITPVPVLGVQLAMGLSAGLIANFTFLFAVQKLGPTIPAASAALVPVIATVGGFVFLGEPISLLKALGIALVALGVLLASGAFPRPQRVREY